MTARRSTAARSANNGLTLLRVRKGGGTDTQELLCNLTGRGDHLTFVRPPPTGWQTTRDWARASARFGSRPTWICQAAEATRRETANACEGFQTAMNTDSYCSALTFDMSGTQRRHHP